MSPKKQRPSAAPTKPPEAEDPEAAVRRDAFVENNLDTVEESPSAAPASTRQTYHRQRDNAAMRRMNTYLPEGLFREMKAFAGVQDVSIADVIERAVRELLQREGAGSTKGRVRAWLEKRK